MWNNYNIYVISDREKVKMINENGVAHLFILSFIEFETSFKPFRYVNLLSGNVSSDTDYNVYTHLMATNLCVLMISVRKNLYLIDFHL